MGIFGRLFRGRSDHRVPKDVARGPVQSPDGKSYHRDFARELRTQSDSSDLITGTRILGTLDERSSLACLLEDGKVYRGEYPRLPHCDSCRCVTSPEVVGAMPSSERASAIGPVPGDGGAYKAYLIARQKLLNSGIEGTDLAERLRRMLPEWRRKYPEPDWVLAAVEACIHRIAGGGEVKDLSGVLSRMSWTAGKEQLKPLFSSCADCGSWDAIDDFLTSAKRAIPKGPYAARHLGGLEALVAAACKKNHPARAIQYLKRACSTDKENTKHLLDLGKLLRSQGQVEEARRVLAKILDLKPDHKGAKTELNRLAG